MWRGEKTPMCTLELSFFCCFFFFLFFNSKFDDPELYSTLRTSERGIEQMRTTNYLLNSIIILTELKLSVGCVEMCREWRHWHK